MKITLARTLSGWAPHDDEAMRVSRRWKAGEVVVVDLKRPRDKHSLGRYWALCELVLNNTDDFKSKEQVSDFFKLRAGHSIAIVAQSTGEVFYIPDSIDYDSLDEVQFQEVWRRVVDVVCMDILPGITSSEVEFEILKCTGLAGGST